MHFIHLSSNVELTTILLGHCLTSYLCLLFTLTWNFSSIVSVILSSRGLDRHSMVLRYAATSRMARTVFIVFIVLIVELLDVDDGVESGNWWLRVKTPRVFIYTTKYTRYQYSLNVYLSKWRKNWIPGIYSWITFIVYHTCSH